jgi:hypothetical protein
MPEAILGLCGGGADRLPFGRPVVIRAKLIVDLSHALGR